MGAGIGLSGGPIGAIGGAGIGLFMDAMSTGQNVKGMASTSPQPLNLVQSGGSLYQSSGHSNGTPLPGLGGLPGSTASGKANVGRKTMATLQLSPDLVTQ